MEEACDTGLADSLTTETELETDPINDDVHHEEEEFVEPSVGMEFESYDDAYNYYNCYAKGLGFRVRVKNSWFKRNSREKYGAVLCCSSQGFKRVKDVNRLRKETRTGCPAMVRMRLVDSKRWRVLEVSLDHNHWLGSKTGSSKSLTKKTQSGPDMVKLYRPLVINPNGDGGSGLGTKLGDALDCLSLKKGDTQALYNYLCRMQLTNPNFFYSMDIDGEGRLRNVFWADARARAASGYFGDVVHFDNTCLSGKFEIPLVALVGTNHHNRPVLLGCGLLSGDTPESYVWFFKTWLDSCASGNSPRTVVTDRSKTLESIIAEVFPGSHHRFSLSNIMKKVPEKLGGLRNYDAIKKSLTKAVYDSLKVVEFEAAWGFMIQRFGISDHDWLRSLYEDRARWAPVYLKDTFFVGMACSRPNETLNMFFEKYVHKQTPLKEFLDKYELALHKRHREETSLDTESRASSPGLKTRCAFESQLARVYTREVFRKFQVEVEEMYSCFSTTQIHGDGPVSIFLVKERVLIDGNRREIRDFEVLFNRTACEVRCICSLFNFCGYLCRHGLCVLNFNGVEEVPTKYILSRWKKDYKRIYIPEKLRIGSVDLGDRVQWFEQLHSSALQIVEEGVASIDHFNVALRAFVESLNRVHDAEEKHL